MDGKRFLITDRDTKFSARFKSILEGYGVEIPLTAYLAPNMNAYAERVVRSIKSECLDQMIFLGWESLVRAIAEYVSHYHEERSHQGIGNELISGVSPKDGGSIEVRERLGGLLKYYYSESGMSSTEFSDTTLPPGEPILLGWKLGLFRLTQSLLSYEGGDSVYV